MVSLFSLFRVGMVIVMVSQVPTANSQLSNVLQTLQGSLGSLTNSFGARNSPVSGDGTTNPRGSRVGPLFLFRSSADNAAIVNEAFRGMIIPRTTFLAIGDEFPKLRDDYISKTRTVSPGNTQTPFQRALSVATNLQNWQLDRDNNQKELNDPFIRPSTQLVNSLRARFLPSGPAVGPVGTGQGSAVKSNPNRFRVSLDLAKAQEEAEKTADKSQNEQ